MDLKDALAPDADLGASPAESERSTHRSVSLPSLAAGMFLGVLVAGAAVWFLGRPGELPRPFVIRLSLPLSTPTEGNLRIDPSVLFIPLAISPNGEQVVYSASTETDRQSRLYLRNLQDADARALPGTEGARSPFFSADGRWIGYSVDGTLRKILPSGGAPIDIGPTTSGAAYLWGPEGEIVFVGGRPSRLWSIPASGGEPVELAVRDRLPGAAIQPLRFLPVESSLLILVRLERRSELQTLSLETGERRTLMGVGTADHAAFLPTDHLIYLEGGTLLAVPVDPRRFKPLADPVPLPHDVYSASGYRPFFSVSDTGTLVYLSASDVREPEFVWVDRAGNAARVPNGEAAFMPTPPRLSPKGNEAVVTLADGRKRPIWIFDLERGTSRLLPGDGGHSPVWTPDGSLVTFGWNQGIFSTSAEGSDEPELLFGDVLLYPKSWSPDGRSLAFSEYPQGRADVDVRIYTAGGIEPLLTTPFSEDWPAFSPDGRFIAFESNESGLPNVYVQPFQGPGPRIQVSIDGGFSARWRPSGGELYYQEGTGDTLTGHADRMMMVNVKTEPNLRIGTPRVLFEGNYRAGFDVTADGDRFLMITEKMVKQPTSLRVVLNWLSELEDLVSTD